MAEEVVPDTDATQKMEDKTPLHEDIMQLARLGEIGPIQKLFEEGKYSIDFRDREGITPLHVSFKQSLSNTRAWTDGNSGQRSIITMRSANT